MNVLAHEIRRQIQIGGPMTVAQFMDMALYAPGLGYYERQLKIGRAGDFLTSVSAGPLFGQLLAHQFGGWLEKDSHKCKIQLIEAGAHDGRLAADILEWMKGRRPELFARLEYHIVESSPTRRAWQAETLDAWNTKVKWVSGIGDFGKRAVNGIIFSNEFLDALPVHRLAWDAKAQQWREWRIIVSGDDFDWQLDSPGAELNGCLPVTPPDLAGVLPDGFITEVSPAATTWWRTAAATLQRGRLLTIDYGFTAENGLRPDHPRGSLRAYFRHHVCDDILGQPGEQDLTADVNFSALEEAGRTAGLGASTLLRQSKFLTEIVAGIQGNPETFAAWDRKLAGQFQTLAHPEHLGHSFYALIQGTEAT